MNRWKTTCLTAALVLAACGGSKTANDIQDNAPTYASSALDMESSDASAPGESAQALGGGDGTCHPFLFLRTRHVVHRLNWHLFKTLFMMDHVIAEHPTATSGSTATWTRKGLKYSFQVVGTKVSETNYTFEVSVKKLSDPDSAYVKVTDANLTVDATAKTQSGTLNFDFTAYSGVVTESKAEGTLAYKFSGSSSQRDIEVTLAGFVPDDDLTDEISPRDAHYVFSRTVGVGGSLKYTDELILLCPKVGGAPNLTARSSVDTVFRWTHLPDGTIVGRGDTQATADATDTNTPNIPSGDKIEGVTCGTLNPAGDVEKYWMMKLETSSGATEVSGSFSYDSDPTVTDPTTACDAAFGTIPSPSDSSTDFNFTSVNFSDSTPASFPQQG